MKEWLIKIGAGIIGLGVLILGIFGLKNFLLSKKADDFVEQNNKDNKVLDQQLKVLDTKEQAVDVKEAAVDQKLADLPNQKVNQTEIADFIGQMEKINEKN